MELPDLESLRCFEAAAVHLNFRAAAAQVALSPSAFSDRIKRLEETLGACLFERTTRAVQLTPAGLRLLSRARETLRAAAACREAVGSGAPVPFELRLGTRWELGLSWIVPALADLESARPERRIQLGFGDSRELMARLARGRLDAVVTSVRLTEAGLDHARLHEETYAFCGAPSLLAAQPLRRAEDAAEHALLDTLPDLPLFRYLLDARPAREVWAFSRVTLLGTIGAIRHRALEGAGVCVLPRYFVAADLEAGRLVEPLPDARLNSDYFRLLWPHGHPLSDAMLALADELRALPLR